MLRLNGRRNAEQIPIFRICQQRTVLPGENGTGGLTEDHYVFHVQAVLRRMLLQMGDGLIHLDQRHRKVAVRHKAVVDIDEVEAICNHFFKQPVGIVIHRHGVAHALVAAEESAVEINDGRAAD